MCRFAEKVASPFTPLPVKMCFPGTNHLPVSIHMYIVRRKLLAECIEFFTAAGTAPSKQITECDVWWPLSSKLASWRSADWLNCTVKSSAAAFMPFCFRSAAEIPCKGGCSRGAGTAEAGITVIASVPDELLLTPDLEQAVKVMAVIAAIRLCFS